MELPDLQATPSDPAALLDEVKRMALERLGVLPGVLFSPIEAHLNAVLKAACDSGTGLGGQEREELMLLKVLRQRSAAHVMRYREQIARSFDGFTGRGASTPRDGQMSLLSEDELEFRLASERLAESLAAAFQSKIDMLDRRFAMLASALGRPYAGNPLAPDRLAEALVIAFRDADLSENLQQLLVEQYQLELTSVLGELYPRVDAALQGVQGGAPASFAETVALRTPGAGAPRTSLAMDARPDVPGASVPGASVPEQRPGQAQPLVGSMRRSGASGAFFRVPAEARERLQDLRSLLHAWRGASAAAPAAGDAFAGSGALRQSGAAQDVGSAEGGMADAPASGARPSGAGHVRELRPEEVINVVSLLQTDIYAPFEHALAGRQPLHQAIREHMHDGAHRLGINLDQALVSQRDADAIDLVGLLFEALSTPGSSTAEVRRLLSRLVMTYVRLALTDENLFVRPGHPAKRLIDAIALSMEDNEGATAHDQALLRGTEQVIERVVAEFNEDLAIFDLAANELQQQVEQQRKRSVLVERRSSEAAQGRERLLQARLQAASALAQRVGGQALTGTISRFLARYWRHHYEQALLRGTRDPARADQAQALADALIELDAAATDVNGPSIAERLMSLQAPLEQCCADSGLDPASTREWFAGIARALAFPDAPRQVHALPATPALSDESDATIRALLGDREWPVDPRVEERVAHLKVGDWLRLADADGKGTAAKVAWISAMSGRLLLVNRRGLPKLTATLRQLAALVSAGCLQLDAEPMPFDQAMQQVRERLGDASTDPDRTA